MTAASKNFLVSDRGEYGIRSQRKMRLSTIGMNTAFWKRLQWLRRRTSETCRKALLRQAPSRSVSHYSDETIEKPASPGGCRLESGGQGIRTLNPLRGI